MQCFNNELTMGIAPGQVCNQQGPFFSDSVSAVCWETSTMNLNLGQVQNFICKANLCRTGFLIAFLGVHCPASYRYVSASKPVPNDWMVNRNLEETMAKSQNTH